MTARCILHGQHLEFPVERLECPAQPIATLVLETGRVVEAAPHGTRVALVCAPGYRFTEVPAFSCKSISGHEAWVGRVPEQPIALTMMVDDTQVSWELAPASTRLAVWVEGESVAGLRFGGALAFIRWPTLCIETGIRDGAFSLTGPMSVTGRFRARLGRILLNSDGVMGNGQFFGVNTASPGVYSFEAEKQGRRGKVSFALLPSDSEPQIHHGHDGTRISARGTVLSHEEHGQVGLDSLLLGVSMLGPVSLRANFRAVSSLTNGRWTLFAAPAAVMVVRQVDGVSLERPFDIGVLRGSGGLRISGAPGTKVHITARRLHWQFFLDSEGRRYFPFSKLPPQLLLDQDRPLELTIKVGDLAEQRFQFDNESAHPPYVRKKWEEDGSCHAWIRLNNRYVESLHLEAVPHHEPWKDPWRTPCEVVSGERTTWYHAPLPEMPGIYYLVLMRGDERVSGITTEKRPEGGTTLPEFSLEVLEAEQATRGSTEPRPATPSTSQLSAQSTFAVGHDGPPSLLPENHLMRVAKTVRVGSSFEERERKIDSRRASLQSRLDSDGCTFFNVLLRPLLRYGTKWFWMTPHLVDLTTEYRLKNLLLDSRATSVLDMCRVFEEANTPMIFTRYDDFQRFIAEHPKWSCDASLRLFKTLIGEQAGLLMSAWTSWQQHLDLDDETFSRLAPYLSQYDRPVRTLSDRQLELLRILEQTDTIRQEDWDQRFLGLLEARRLRQNSLRTGSFPLVASPKERELRQWDERGISPKVQNAIPSDVRELESQVIHHASHLHAWRNGEKVERGRLQEARKIWSALPLLMDYWLNRWATIKG